MKIYTKTGDEGETSLVGGKRVSKSNLKVDVYGDVDELNSVLGVARSHIRNRDDKSFIDIDNELKTIQNRLFDLGSYLATPDDERGNLSFRIDDEIIDFLERSIDIRDSELTPLRYFILPGGSIIASSLHHSRTICRRVERRMISLNQYENIDPFQLKFINRLSDFLFNLARFVNKLEGIDESKWKKLDN